MLYCSFKGKLFLYFSKSDSASSISASWLDSGLFKVFIPSSFTFFKVIIPSLLLLVFFNICTQSLSLISMFAFFLFQYSFWLLLFPILCREAVIFDFFNCSVYKGMSVLLWCLPDLLGRCFLLLINFHFPVVIISLLSCRLTSNIFSVALLKASVTLIWSKVRPSGFRLVFCRTSNLFLSSNWKY